MKATTAAIVACIAILVGTAISFAANAILAARQSEVQVPCNATRRGVLYVKQNDELFACAEVKRYEWVKVTEPDEGVRVP